MHMRKHFQGYLKKTLMLIYLQTSSPKAGSGESDVADNLEEASENIAAISNLCQGRTFL
jgi:hypothetical protein